MVGSPSPSDEVGVVVRVELDLPPTDVVEVVEDVEGFCLIHSNVTLREPPCGMV